MQWEKAFVTFVVDNLWQFPCFIIGGIEGRKAEKIINLPKKDGSKIKELWHILQSIVLEITMTEQEQRTKCTTIVVGTVLIPTQVVVRIIRMDCTLRTTVQIRVWLPKFVKPMVGFGIREIDTVND